MPLIQPASNPASRLNHANAAHLPEDVPIQPARIGAASHAYSHLSRSLEPALILGSGLAVLENTATFRLERPYL